MSISFLIVFYIEHSIFQQTQFSFSSDNSDGKPTFAEYLSIREYPQLATDSSMLLFSIFLLIYLFSHVAERKRYQELVTLNEALKSRLEQQQSKREEKSV